MITSMMRSPVGCFYGRPPVVPGQHGDPALLLRASAQCAAQDAKTAATIAVVARDGNGEANSGADMIYITDLKPRNTSANGCGIAAGWASGKKAESRVGTIDTFRRL